MPRAGSPGYLRKWAKSRDLTLDAVSSTEAKQYQVSDPEIVEYDEKHRVAIYEIKDWLVEWFRNHPMDFPIPQKEWGADPETGEAAPFATRDECFKDFAKFPYALNYNSRRFRRNSEVPARRSFFFLESILTLRICIFLPNPGPRPSEVPARGGSPAAARVRGPMRGTAYVFRDRRSWATRF